MVSFSKQRSVIWTLWNDFLKVAEEKKSSPRGLVTSLFYQKPQVEYYSPCQAFVKTNYLINTSAFTKDATAAGAHVFETQLTHTSL